MDSKWLQKPSSSSMVERRPNATILLIENDDNASVSMRRLLECEGYAVVSARTITEAVGITTSTSKAPTLVLLNASNLNEHDIALTGDHSPKQLLANAPLFAIAKQTSNHTIIRCADVVIDPTCEQELLLRLIQAWCGNPLGRK